MIKNVSGVDYLGRNPTDRGRMATKMSMICATAMVPVSCTFYGANIADVTTTEASVDAINCRIKKDSRYTNVLIGDKGYVSKKVARALDLKRITMLTPKKKNSKDRNRMSDKNKSMLKRRHRVENTFCRFDKFKRLHCRVDRHLCNYIALNQLAMMIVTLKVQDRAMGNP
jgi:putative transposase